MKSLFALFLSLAATTKQAAGFAAPLEIDAAKAFRESKFPINPDDLIARAKEVLGPEIGIGTQDGGECLADNFEFCAAVVGPLPKKDYMDALGSFKLEDSFDIVQNSFGFTVSPMQTNRVYWFNQQTATLKAPFVGVPPEKVDGDLELPPQCLHMDFNEDGKVTKFGFYTVDRESGNTGGLGGAFGFFYGVGRPLPIRECHPFKPSFRFRMLNLLGRLMKKMKGSKKDE